MGISNALGMTIYILMLVVLICGIINYIFTSLALYKVAKIEKNSKAWLAWIPIGNAYILIKSGKGNYLFIIPLVGAMFTNGILSQALMAVFVIYSMIMYHRICERYDVNFIFIGIGAVSLIIGLSPVLNGLIIPIFLIGLYGQWKLYRKVSSMKENTKGPKIKSKITI